MFTRDSTDLNPFGSAIRTQMGSLSKVIPFRYDPEKVSCKRLGSDPKLVRIGSEMIKLKSLLLKFQREESQMRQSLLECKISKDLIKIRRKVYYSTAKIS